MALVLGMMSGTSLDGVDAALIDTDGEVIAGLRPQRMARLRGKRGGDAARGAGSLAGRRGRA